MQVWPLRVGEPVHMSSAHGGRGAAVAKAGLDQAVVAVVTVNVPVYDGWLSAISEAEPVTVLPR